MGETPTQRVVRELGRMPLTGKTLAKQCRTSRDIIKVRLRVLTELGLVTADQGPKDAKKGPPPSVYKLTGKGRWMLEVINRIR